MQRLLYWGELGDGQVSLSPHLPSRQKVGDILRLGLRGFIDLLGYLKKSLDSDDRADIVAAIKAYRQGLVLLVAPLLLCKHHFQGFEMGCMPLARVRAFSLDSVERSRL